ncbi:hypothetical protein VPH35_095490 [Triticum aestivum]
MAIMDSSHAAGARHQSPPSTVRPESGREPDEAEPSRPDPLQQSRSSSPPPRAVQLTRPASGTTRRDDHRPSLILLQICAHKVQKYNGEKEHVCVCVVVRLRFRKRVW